MWVVILKNFADRLLDKIDEVQNPSCIGLDPRIADIPSSIKREALEKFDNTFEAVSHAIYEFNKRIIDATCDIVGVYKPQMAFYEQYKGSGIEAFEKTVQHIKSKNCIVIEDAKRNDIKDTAQAYSDGHLGTVELCRGNHSSSLDVDAITVNAYLGSDCIKPFIENCKKFGKGIFILVKTSNPSSGEFQDIRMVDGKLNFVIMAENVNRWGEGTEGRRNYRSVGAVVGATYPQQAQIIRKIIPKVIFLVPGYGAQGGGAKDVMPCFNRDGYGAVVNSARGIIFAYQTDKYKTKEENFDKAAEASAADMKDDILKALKDAGIFPW